MAANGVKSRETSDSPIPTLNKSSPMNQSVTSTGSDEVYNSTLLNCSSSGSPKVLMPAPPTAGRLAVKTDHNKRRSFSPYKFPLHTPEISPIEKQLADTSSKAAAAPQARKYLTPKAPRDQFVTIRGRHGVTKSKNESLKDDKKVPKTESRVKSVNKSYLFQVRVSPNTLFTSPLENSGSDKSANGSLRNVSGQDLSAEVMEQTLCVESILKDLSLQKYMDIFIAEEVRAHAEFQNGRQIFLLFVRSLPDRFSRVSHARQKRFVGNRTDRREGHGENLADHQVFPQHQHQRTDSGLKDGSPECVYTCVLCVLVFLRNFILLMIIFMFSL
jgi:hypothetical protein